MRGIVRMPVRAAIAPTSRRITGFTHASTSRKVADTAVPIVPPISRNASNRSRSANAVSAMPSVAAITIVE